MLYSMDRTADYSGRDVSTCEPQQGSNVVMHPACKRWIKPEPDGKNLFAGLLELKTTESFSSALWRDACRRHSAPRTHFRELLNKYIHPHTPKE